MTEPPRQSWGQYWRDPITYFTLLLVVVGFLQWRTLAKTDETLRLQQRAWLTPVGADLGPIPVKDEMIGFGIRLINSGREPATSINVKILNSTIDGISTKATNLADVDVPENTSCDGLKPQRGRADIPPTGTGYTTITQGSGFGEPRLVADDKIVSGDKFYLVRGCLAYLTQEKEKHSAFCYILASVLPPPTPQNHSPIRAYGFVTCRNGFDAN